MTRKSSRGILLSWDRLRIESVAEYSLAARPQRCDQQPRSRSNSGNLFRIRSTQRRGMQNMLPVSQVKVSLRVSQAAEAAQKQKQQLDKSLRQHVLIQNGSEPMTAMDRRSILRGILCGAAVATVGFSMMPNVAESLPLAADKNGAAKPDGLVERAQVVVGPRRRRRRRRVCFWRRGRRVCVWR